MTDLTTLTIADAGEALRARALSPVDLTEAYLDRIERHNPLINAYVTVTADRARDDARAAEAEISSGRYRGPLHGIPIALKDLYDTRGIRTTAASKHFRDCRSHRTGHRYRRRRLNNRRGICLQCW